MTQPAGIGGRGGTVLAVIWGENFLTLILIGLRFYTRHFIRGKVGWDDYWLIVTWLLMVIFGALTSVGVGHGMGQHPADLTTEQFADGVFYITCAQVIASLAIGMCKVVVATFLLRIVTATWQRWFLWFCIGSMMLLSFILSSVVFAQCSPVESIWNPLLADKKVCHINLTILAFVDCSYAAFLDFVLAGFPWIALRNLNMKRKERITICISLSLGVFAGICGVIRTSGLGALNQTNDYLYAMPDNYMWTFTEVSTTIICVTIGSFRPLWNKLRGHDSSSGGGYQQHNSSGYGGKGPYQLSSYSRSKKSGGKKTNTFTSRSDKEDVEAIAGTMTKPTIKNDSDETILLQGSGSIVRVNEIAITYEDTKKEGEASGPIVR
ncbi:unnamed protein product [Clonostachys rosea f. rosea IK726]|uniref:Uncharacterized protein n=1 Tax=Clonostachys rosea f. rosea IK726 TaxID=1349383 RepID=A0ACA9UV67_BIOOC|nr:unnamed protein product [Clonostachys rosea f. rosea IK726]